VKKKYQKKESDSPYVYMTWPKALMRDYHEAMRFIENKTVKERVFFPKNNAMTDVELHSWQDVENPQAMSDACDRVAKMIRDAIAAEK
jgi:hypothetical protein